MAAGPVGHAAEANRYYRKQCVYSFYGDVVSVLLQSGISGLNVLSSGCAAVMLSEKKMKKDREIVLELETQIKGRPTQRILL